MNEPEYTKVIEAANIVSQVDIEAEFNRDPKLVRAWTLMLASACIMGFFVYRNVYRFLYASLKNFQHIVSMLYTIT